MTDREVYDKYFIDEEYELETAPSDVYSYRIGWNAALKRASIIMRDEVRPKGYWIVTAEDTEGIHRIQCPFCKYEKGTDFASLITVTFEKFPPFCEKCGAALQGGAE